MINRIMPSRAAAVAFAASALVASPALADPSSGHKHKPNAHGALQLDLGKNVSLTLASNNWAHSRNSRYGYGDYRRSRTYGHRGYGYQERYRIKQLRREAIRLCKQAVRYESKDRGFRRVFLDDVERVKQIGPRGFVVRGEFEFEGRRRDFERDVTCTVRRGRVVDIDNLPRPRRGANGHNGYSNNGYRNDRPNNGYRGNRNGY